MNEFVDKILLFKFVHAKKLIFQLTYYNLFPSRMCKFNSEEPVQDQNMAMTVNDGSGYEWTELNMTLMKKIFILRRIILVIS